MTRPSVLPAPARRRAGAFRAALATALAAALSAHPAACQDAADQPSERLVDIGTHRLQMRVAGGGFPTVVIDAGIGDGIDKLRPLQDRLARSTCVVTYDRAGYGRSEPGPLPRDAGREAQELKTLLERAQVPGPYVLVGHSLGGLTAQLFAARYTADVAGLVLLDPPPLSFLAGREYGDLRAMAERMTAEWQAIADKAAGAAGAEGRAQAAFYRMIASEHREMFGESARQAEAIEGFGDIPLVVMAAGKPNPAFGPVAEAYQKYWVEQSRALAAKSTRAKFVIVPDASHYLYVDAMELVATTVGGVLQEWHFTHAKPR